MSKLISILKIENTPNTPAIAKISIKIHAAFYENSDTAAIPKGTVVSLKNGNIGVAATHGIIYLTMVQPENHKRMKTIDFINGYQVKTNDCFEY